MGEKQRMVSRYIVIILKYSYLCSMVSMIDHVKNIAIVYIKRITSINFCHKEMLKCKV